MDMLLLEMRKNENDDIFTVGALLRNMQAVVSGNDRWFVNRCYVRADSIVKIPQNSILFWRNCLLQRDSSSTFLRLTWPCLSQEDQLLVTVGDFIAASSDTTTNTLRWCILGLSTNQEHQERMYQEISDVIGNQSYQDVFVSFNYAQFFFRK